MAPKRETTNPNADDIAALEREIADVRANIIELTEQAAAYSGAADDDLSSRRIAEQEAQLKRLTEKRDRLEKGQ
ncbi:hypothetical protein OSH08_05255 [Kaistia geumhonensis]|uniref:Cell division protein FtsB n=1 Tax=Kaistia geumhonensis TaxID=410839 RepID=A0ABU0M5Z1_9HYPH|nr:hypothetical protein [Kaistia geumhonensis]MCX5478399.1 hypothetical protein [Kaistia geumhonensis]MDQ0516383.1 cell division protein FtsB [Kaistia geumhonensis]